jgi:imidazolonepropionase
MSSTPPVVLTDLHTPSISQAALVIDGARVAWVGPAAEVPAAYRALPRESLGGRFVTPALIDCHTHLVHGGERAAEWAARLGGADYRELARMGGGIRATVAATRAADEAALTTSALRRLDALVADGVATVEIKSGYGLDTDTELRMLRVARQLGTLRPVRVTTTFLGAHAVPLEWDGDADGYLDLVVLPTLHAAHAAGLVDAVDAFCERIAFSAAQVERLFAAAQALGLPVTVHAEQLSHSGGAALAARLGARSADHLEYATDADAAAMAASGTVAVLLPGAYYVLRETQPPPIAAFRRHGTRMAIATDCNPGTSPLTSLRLAMHLACTLLGLTPQEALDGATQHAAAALRLSDRGTLTPGARADLAVWDVGSVNELVYHLGASPLHRLMIGGTW